jgi:hypothetical protein
MNNPLVLQLPKVEFVGPRQHPIALIGPNLTALQGVFMTFGKSPPPFSYLKA